MGARHRPAVSRHKMKHRNGAIVDIASVGKAIDYPKEKGYGKE